MIVLDVKTSGLDFNKCGIWQIGAIEFENLENAFLEEARIDNEDESPMQFLIPYETALEKKVRDEKLRDPNKQSQKQLLEKFLNWCESVRINNYGCMYPHIDLGFIITKAQKYGLKPSLYNRCFGRIFDLHSIAQGRYIQVHKKLLIKRDHSAMSLCNILDFVGMDNISPSNYRKDYNALDDAKLEAECFSRLIFGKSLIPEYSKFTIPEYLVK